MVSHERRVLCERHLQLELEIVTQLQHLQEAIVGCPCWCFLCQSAVAKHLTVSCT